MKGNGKNGAIICAKAENKKIPSFAHKITTN
jgi:hypothetical protein